MHIDLASIAQQYGYLAIFFGAIFEGETVLVVGGFAAHQGYLQLPSIVALAALGGFVGDQLYFGAGRLFGARLVSWFPSLVPKIHRIDQFVSRYPTFSVIAVRFLYGFRIAGPIAIGMTTMLWVRFAIFNLIGAVAWATAITGIGYVFGHAAEKILGDLRQHEAWIVGLLLLIALAVHFLGKFKKKKH